jgi:predicted nucleotidyltransferase
MVNDEILDIKDAILEAAGAVEKIYLFGSYAYGTPHKDSDYDFYVLLPDASESPFVVIPEIYRQLYKTKRQTPVDVLANYKTRFEERSCSPTMERKIVRDGVLLYERV